MRFCLASKCRKLRFFNLIVDKKVIRSCLCQKAGRVLYEEGHYGNPAAVSASDTITVVHNGSCE
jgi:hypothetical protein